ncbi:hypothetical protein SVIO_065960 [Streptomyces violaceusniger]|uniref:Lipoprotein n=1 Tax=Streptomyces violaceusniger TaxID=68280 RepID=A0A4D4LD17_STRVO|nr:hypothetical protein SVIO_065960 [Streptomyces violaceusniger]
MKVASAVLLACALTACSSGSGEEAKNSQHGTGDDQPGKKVVRINVPSAYDNSRGWQEPVAAGGLDGTVPLATAPAAA